MATIGITDAGRAYLASLVRLTGRPATEPNYVAIGTGTTAFAVSQTALVTEVETRANGTSAQTTTTVANDTFRTVGTITATAARTVAESGMFSAATVGTMAARQEFSTATIGLAIGDSIQGTWDIKIA